MLRREDNKVVTVDTECVICHFISVYQLEHLLVLTLTDYNPNGKIADHKKYLGDLWGAKQSAVIIHYYYLSYICQASQKATQCRQNTRFSPTKKKKVLQIYAH